MKFPKLKHSLLCDILLVLPAFAVFWYLLLCLLLFGDVEMDAVFLVGLLLTIAFSLWYLFSHFLLFNMVSVPLAYIRLWKRDRLEYRTARNGRDRAASEKRILWRCRRWGKRYLPNGPGAEQVQVFYRHGLSWTVFYSVIEKRAAVCSVDHLTKETFRSLLEQAQFLLRQVPAGKPRLKSRSEKKAPRAFASVLVILADRVDAEVKLSARKAAEKSEEDCLLPCVVECPSGAYYLDGMRSYYMVGMTGRPAKNYASVLLRRLVFGGRLPLKDKTMRPPYPREEDLNMSLWEFLRICRAEIKGSDAEEKKERKKMLRRLKDGEVRVGAYAVYCKVGERLAAYAFFADAEDEKKLVLQADGRWYFPRKTKLPIGGNVMSRKMKKTDSDAIRRLIGSRLTEDGYTVESDGSDT